jgi:hypothetical protein
MLRAVPLLAAAALLTVPALAQAQQDTTARATALHTIRTSGGYVNRIGAYRPWRDPSLAAAERVFGPASVRTLIDDSACRVDWRRLRLRILFANFGGDRPGETTCSPRGGNAQAFTVRGRGFRTWKGLRVGHRSDAILDRHPLAEFRQSSWWLRTAISPYGPGEQEFGVVRAIVSGGRVTAIKGWIGAAGD